MTNEEIKAYYQPVLSQLVNFRWTGEGENGEACCPAHQDRHKSLSVKIGRDGELLLNCHADKGCTFDEIATALGRPRGSGKMKDFFLPREAPPVQERIDAIFDYVDEEGEVRYQSIRMIPKRIFQRRPDPHRHGGYINNLDGVKLLPFHLPELLDAPKTRTVFVVEGEPKVLALEEHGFVATCNAGGSEKWRLEWGPHFQGRPVAVLPDHDENGWKHAWTVLRCLDGCASPLRVVELPGIRLKEDVVDWFGRLGGNHEYRRQRLINAVDNSHLWDTHRTNPQLKLMHFRMDIARALTLHGAH